MISTLKKYFSLTKPGIVLGNSLAVLAGFLFASQNHISAPLFFSITSGMACVIASACVINNYIDRDKDALMERTKNRALVRKHISGSNALIFGSILGLLGFLILLSFTNLLTTYIALLGFIIYVVVYGVWKRRSSYGTVVGSIAGAIPPVAGYTAVSGTFDLGALLLFLILSFWQMPHFLAISIFRINEYAAASIPVLPIERGIAITKKVMLLYVIFFGITSLLLYAYDFVGYLYLILMAVSISVWLVLSVRGLSASDNFIWARKMFISSIIVLMIFCIALPLDIFLNNAMR